MNNNDPASAVKVKDLVLNTFGIAHQRQRPIYESWIRSSVQIGGQLPNSLLMMAVQQIGALDLVLRCMEEETNEDMQRRKEADWSGHYQNLLSETWICNSYEIFRLLRSRRLTIRDDVFESLALDLKLLRIAIAKHEIAEDWKLPAQVPMAKSRDSKEATSHYMYRRTDRRRAHVMRRGLSHRGSWMWEATNAEKYETVWLERLALSDRILSLWDSQRSRPKGGSTMSGTSSTPAWIPVETMDAALNAAKAKLPPDSRVALFVISPSGEQTQCVTNTEPPEAMETAVRQWLDQPRIQLPAGGREDGNDESPTVQ